MPSRSRTRARKTRNITGAKKSNHPYALLLVDVINELEFAGGEKLRRPALAMARRIAVLRRRAQEAGVPCVYVNDNFGRWRSDFRALVERCLHSQTRGHEIAALLAPGEKDYFVLKPLHSGFFTTTLDLLLRELGTRKLIICGLVTEGCVLFTAADAYIRGFEVSVPRDGCASKSAARHRNALEIMRKMLKVDTTPSAQVEFRRG